MVEKTIGMLGRTLIIAGILPATLWLALNLIFLWQPHLPLADRLQMLGARPEWLGALIAAAVGGGILLFAFNATIIHWFEGVYPIQRRWLLAWLQRRNQQRHDELYERLLSVRRMRDEALEHLIGDNTHEHSEEWRRRADSSLIAVDQAHADIERRQPVRPLPLRKDLVLPTALGNAYAVMEEYPYEHYGMDSMVFWPRLIAVVPEMYAKSIGDQKTICDLLLHLALMLGIFAAEAAAAPLIAGARPELLLVALLSLLAGYGLYRAAVAETAVLGKLVAGAFDLYRGKLMRQLGIEPPERLDEERQVWQSLAAFIRRGDAFYYPAAERVEKERATRRA